MKISNDVICDVFVCRFIYDFGFEFGSIHSFIFINIKGMLRQNAHKEAKILAWSVSATDTQKPPSVLSIL